MNPFSCPNVQIDVTPGPLKEFLSESKKEILALD